MGERDSEIRADGRALARELREYERQRDVVVLALTPAVLPLATEVAAALTARLDLFLVRPLTVIEPRQLSIGAVASGGVLVLDATVVKQHDFRASTIDEAAQAKARVLARQEDEYRARQDPVDLRLQRAIIVVEDHPDLPSIRMAIAALRRRWVASVVVAAPSMPRTDCQELLLEADAVVAALADDPVGTRLVDTEAGVATPTAAALTATSASLGIAHGDTVVRGAGALLPG
jgi:predicted phosphoribosyltransferase